MTDPLTRGQFLRRTAGVGLAAYLLARPIKLADALAALEPAPTLGVRVGDIVEAASANAPPGWLVCDGSTIDVSAYPLLYRALDTKFGGSRWSRRFRVPDLRGRTTVGHPLGPPPAHPLTPTTSFWIKAA